MTFSLRASITLFSLLCMTVTASAYIPSSRTVAGRLARNAGKGLYVIEQEVQFRTTSEPVTLRERWVIENGDTMRLTVTNPKSTTEVYRFDAVYRDSKRTAPDLKGGTRTTPVSAEFIETFSHARSSKGFLDSLVRAGVVPSSILRERVRFNAQKAYVPEPLVRLGRSGGVVNYVFGEPTPPAAQKQNPGAWIEQDAFLLRRIRFPSEAEVISDRHSTFANSLRLARERTVNWESNSALIRVISVRLADSQSAALLNPASLTANDSRAARLPEQTQVKEFYARFR